MCFVKSYMDYHEDLSLELDNWPPMTVGETRADMITLESKNE